MRNDTEALSLTESKRLIELEQTIERGQKTFVEVGLALAEIRDLKLYKSDYTSFAEYCREKWGWEKAYANHMVRAAIVVQSLPEKVATIVATESQARELGRIPTENRAEVIEGIIAEGQPLTAAQIKRHFPPVPMQPKNSTPAPPDQVLDRTGWPVPTHLIPLWLRMDEAQELLTILSRVKGALRTAQENKDKLFAEVSFSFALAHLDQASGVIKTAKPFAVCPTCQGQLPDNCTLCCGRGLVSEHRWNACVTREDKEFRIRANAARN